MTHRKSMRTGLRLAAAVLVAGSALALGACSQVPHHRHDSGDPDVRLATALRELDLARSTGKNNNVVRDHERVIVDSNAAKDRIEQLALEFPTHGPTLLVNANLAFEAHDTVKAQQHLDRLLELEPDNVFAGILRAQICLQEGNLPLAKRIIENQIEIAPDSPHLHETMASIHFFAGDLDAAEKSLARAEHLGRDEWSIAYHRGLIAERRGDVAGARAQFRKASDLNPSHIASRAHLIGLEPIKPASESK